MEYKRHSHCGWCGAPFEEGAAWPRTCATCQNTTYVNPLPVAVALVPIGEGLLAIRRGIPPHQGRVALPGGYIDRGESWQEGAAREVREETGVVVDPASFRVYDVWSAPDGTVLIFGLCAPIDPSALPAFVPTSETSERLVLTEKLELAFPLHTRVAHRWLDQA